MILGSGHPSCLPTFLSTCVELLRPESSCSLDVRLHTIQVMHKAVDAFLNRQSQQTEGASAPDQQQTGAGIFGGSAAGSKEYDRLSTSVWPTYAVEVGN
jgi:hypothetical protein